jgi:monothiol glutaredoxin
MLSSRLGPLFGKRGVNSFSLCAHNYLRSNCFSTADSHDDFKPKRKIIADGMSDVVQSIDKQVKENPIIIYMKGTPSKPMCGFSLQAVRILNASGVTFQAVNVLEHPAIREAIKEYSDWPTIPQLYVKGEFIGGCDIVTQMYKDGELEKLFKQHNLVEA